VARLPNHAFSVKVRICRSLQKHTSTGRTIMALAS
jgi:hypothetical protein